MKAQSIPEAHLASGDYLAVVRDFALSKGIELKDLLRNTNIELQDLLNPPHLVTNLIVSNVGINLFNALDCPVSGAIDFGLKMTASTHGSLGLAVQCAATLDEAFQILRAFYNTRLAGQDIVISEDESSICIRLRCKESSALDNPIQHFFDISTLVTIASNTYQALDKASLSGQIVLDIDAPRPLGFLSDTLAGVKVNFGQEELQILTPIGWKHARLSISNEEVAKAALEKCEAELKQVSPLGLVSRVTMLISNSVDSLPKLNEVAVMVNMSPATLKRKLKENDTSYLEIKNRVRLEQASLMICDHQSIEFVAERMGFSDASNFTKAFKLWTGQTPKSYRESRNGSRQSGGNP